MISFLFAVSRPRFWMYTIGPYLIGIGAASNFDAAVLDNPTIWLWLIFFSFPANLYIYGLNDFGDEDTDAFNDKKGSYEVRLKKTQKRVLLISIAVSIIPFIPLVLSASWKEIVCWLLFMVFGWIYSLKPLRLKARPFVDSLSNGVLYTMAGVMAFYAAGGEEFSWLAYGAGALWAATMHAYSAIPDIAADTRAGIRTIATVLGAQKTLLVCGGAYTMMAIMLMISGHAMHAFLAVPYLSLIALSMYFQKKTSNVFTIYKVYPYVTYCCGALVYILSVSRYN